MPVKNNRILDRIDTSKLIEKIQKIQNERDFYHLAREVFLFQYQNCKVFRDYCKLIGFPLHKIEDGIFPYLPISFFKHHNVYSSDTPVEKYFMSSGTGGLRSKHPIASLNLYKHSAYQSFKHFYGEPQQYAFLALLPNYIEQGDSSLVYMLNYFIELSEKKGSGFYLYNHQDLFNQLLFNEEHNITSILWGVSYALLDFAEKYRVKLTNTIVMETGGMKGRRKEMVRDELHSILKEAFSVDHIHSEYGMTELMSQAYSKRDGIFNTPPQMKISVRDINDPFETLPAGKTGVIRIIDLYNIFSCSFIETEDTGYVINDGSFVVTGRLDYAEMRGCNLLIEK